MPYLDNISDANIWNSFRSGDEKALVYLIETYSNPLIHYGRKISSNEDALKDCLQDTFIDLWKYRGSLKSLTEIRPYLFSCFRRKVLKSFEPGRYVSIDEYNEEYIFDIEFCIEEKLIKGESEAKKVYQINECLNHLSKKRKEAIYLKFYEGLSNDEIASVMGVKYQTATNLISEALTMLRNIIPSKAVISLITACLLRAF